MAVENASESLAALLEADPDYRVLRRLPTATVSASSQDDRKLVGIVVDVETTGLDVDLDEVIELGMIKFEFDRSGNVGAVCDIFQAFNEPQSLISPEITALTGIGNADVKGHTIAAEAVSQFVDGAALVIAHNAPFDRPFCERIAPIYREVPWACTATEVAWKSYGISGSRLEYIVASYGRFYEAHRALDDCNAVLNVLGFLIPGSTETVFNALLVEARKVRARVFAEHAPFDLRIGLKRMGYRWNDGTNGYPRAWWRDVEPNELEGEIDRLADMSQGKIAATVVKMTSRNRFQRKSPHVSAYN